MTENESDEALGEYLNHHLAGAAAGLELAEAAAARNAGTPVGDFLAGLTEDIEADRSTLAGLIERLDYKRSVLAGPLGWVGEKTTRLKFSHRGGSPLRLLLELETLSLGVRGKLLLWEALAEVSGSDSRFVGTDFQVLIVRARQQVAGIEQHRLDAARTAVSS